MSKLIDINNLEYNNSIIQNKLDKKLNTSLKGTNNGLAELDSSGKVPASQLPSFVDNVIEGYLYNGKFYKESVHTTEITAESGKIYTDLPSNKTYRWGGTAYTEISPSIPLGETSSTAYRGDRGKVAYDHSQVTHAPSNAQPNQNAFSNVTIGSTTIAADSVTDTLTLVAGNNITLTPDATNDNITITATNTTYGNATTSSAGLMSSGDKTKLNGIESGAEVNQNAFSNITNGTNTISASGKTDTLTIVGGGATSVTYDTTNKKLTISSTDNNTTYSTATTSANGLMSSGDKTKLNGIASGAEVNQNAFQKVSDGTSTITAGGKTDTLTIVGSGATSVSYDTTNKKLTISSTDNNTDTKVTSVDNHYSPSENTSSQLSIDASSSTAATWNSTSLVTGVDIKRDAKGHVTGIAVDSIKMPANPNTNTTYTLSSPANANTIVLTPSSGSANTVTLKAGSNITLTGTTAGEITIASTDTNTWRGIQNNLTSDSTSDSLSANQGRLLANGSARDSTKLPLSGGTMTGDLFFSDSGTTIRQIRGVVGANDYWRIAGGATASNSGWMEIATADDGNEPIYVRQYSGVYTTISRTLTLLDASGNTTIPGTLNVGNITHTGTINVNQTLSVNDRLITTGTNEMRSELRVGYTMSGGTWTAGTGSLWVASDANIRGKIYGNGADLGDITSSSIYNNGTFNTNGNTTFDGTATFNRDVKVNASLEISGTTRTYGDLITYSMKPYETNTYNIGNSSKYYKNAYINKTYVGSNSCSWVAGRSNAAIIQNTFNQYSPLLSMKTTDGSWEVGVYTGNILHFSYITDTNFNANTNTQTVDIQFRPDGIISGKASSASYADSAGAVAWSNVTGKPTIPTVNNGTLSIQVGGTTKTTFTANQSGNSTFNITKDMITGLGIPGSDTNTHYNSNTIVNNSTTATSNTSTALTNGNVYLNHIENGAVRNSHKISGSGATTVTSDASGNIIISSTDNNTTYSANNGVGLSGTTFYNSGVRSIATGGSNGTISVNTNGTTADVAVKGLGSAAYTASTAYAAASHNHTSLTNVYSITGDPDGILGISGDAMDIDFNSIVITSESINITSTTNAINITGETGVYLNDTTVTGTLTADKIVCKSNNKLGIAYASSASGNYQAGLRIGDVTPGNTSYTTLCNDTVCANSLDVKGTLKMSGTSVLSKFLQYVNMSVSNKSSVQTFSSYVKFKLNNATTIMIAWGCTNAGNNTNISFPTSFSYIPSVTLSDFYSTTTSVIGYGAAGTSRKQLISVTASAFKYRAINQYFDDEENPHYTFWIAVGVS